MGEEEKKQPDEVKKPEEAVEEKKKDDSPAAAAGGGGGGDEKADGEAKAGEDKKDESPAPPPPPPEIVLRVFMHCEGCARKVRRCLKGFDGVEEVVTDCKTHTVVVKGEKADPIKVLERVQKKSHRQVELLSPIPPPPPPAEEPKKPPEEPVPAEEKKEPQVVSVILKVHMHCEACAQEIKRRIQRMKGVENVEPDFKGSLVTVKGIFEPPTLVDYIAKRTGKRVEIVKVEPEKADAAEEGPKEEDKTAAAEGGEKKEEKTSGAEDAGGKEKKEGAGAPPADVPAEIAGTVVGFPDQDDPKLELRKNEFFYYYYPPPNYYHLHVPPPPLPPPRYGHQEIYGYGVEGHQAPPPPPQMFSDDNPNACSVM